MNVIDYTYDSYYTQLGTSSLFLSLILIFPPRFHSLTDQHILDYGQSFHLPYYMYWMDKHLYIILVNSHYMKQYMCTYIIIYLCIYLCMYFNTYLCMHIYIHTHMQLFSLDKLWCQWLRWNIFLIYHLYFGGELATWWVFSSKEEAQIAS